MWTSLKRKEKSIVIQDKTILDNKLVRAVVETIMMLTLKVSNF